jgi:hypothetical protein
MARHAGWVCAEDTLGQWLALWRRLGSGGNDGREDGHGQTTPHVR